MTFSTRLLWVGSLFVAHSLLLNGLEAIAQQISSTGSVSRDDLLWIRQQSGGILDDGRLVNAIPMQNVYGFCPQDGNWLHSLEFDPDQHIVLIVHNCELVGLDYRIRVAVPR
jgi:hypothetical protein